MLDLLWPWAWEQSFKTPLVMCGELHGDSDLDVTMPSGVGAEGGNKGRMLFSGLHLARSADLSHNSS